MIHKTEALVLRVTPFSRTSHIVTWLTADHGKIATVVKGACRPKSMFLGQYDLFYTCEMIFYAREHNGLHIIKECSPIKTRTALRKDWRASSCASYICDLVSKVSPRGGPQPEIYDVAGSTLDSLCSNGAKPELLFWFEIRLLTATGLGPQLMECSACGRSLPLSRSCRFSSIRGGILCPVCAAEPFDDATPGITPQCPSRGSRTSHLADGAVTVSPDTVAALRCWQNTRSPRAARNIRCTAHQLVDFRELLGIFLSYHFDVTLSSREITFQLIALGQH